MLGLGFGTQRGLGGVATRVGVGLGWCGLRRGWWGEAAATSGGDGDREDGGGGGGCFAVAPRRLVWRCGSTGSRAALLAVALRWRGGATAVEVGGPCPAGPLRLDGGARRGKASPVASHGCSSAVPCALLLGSGRWPALSCGSGHSASGAPPPPPPSPGHLGSVPLEAVVAGGSEVVGLMDLVQDVTFGASRGGPVAGRRPWRWESRRS